MNLVVVGYITFLWSFFGIVDQDARWTPGSQWTC